MSDHVSFKASHQITVMLKGLTFDAVVSIDVWSAEISNRKQPNTEFPEGAYNITADLSNFDKSRNLTLNAVSIGNNIGVTLTLNSRSIDFGSQENCASILGDVTNFSYKKSTAHALAEKGPAWGAYSNHNSTSKRGKKGLYGSANCIVIPSDTVLNLRTLVNAFDRLSTQQIEEGVQKLIDLLDYRNGDPDLEVDVDFEPEIEEENAHLI